MAEPSAIWPDPDIERRREAWLAHVPKDCRIVFIGEAPPPKARYFYYPESREHDDLFLQLIQVLYPELQTLSSGAIRTNKPALLNRFAGDGYLLIDAVEKRIPLEGRDAAIKEVRANQEDLLNRIKAVGHNLFVAIPVKVTVQDGLSPDTKSRIGAQFIQDRIPFPGYGQKTNFRRMLSLTLKTLIQRPG